MNKICNLRLQSDDEATLQTSELYFRNSLNFKIMDNGNGLFSLIKAHITEFRVGGVLGFIGSGSWLFLNGGSWYHLIGEWIVRLIFTVIIAICSAIGAAWAKDLYSNYKAYRKKKENEYRRQKERERRDRAA